MPARKASRVIRRIAECSRIGIRPIERAQAVLATSSGCMKILYFGSERSDAKAVAAALRGIDRNLEVAWASRVEDASKWLESNQDLAALIAEFKEDLDGCTRADLEQKLAHATAALHEAEQRHLAAMTAAREQLAQREAQYEIGMTRAAANWEMADEQLRAATIEVERAGQKHASAAAESERLLRRESELSTQIAQEVDKRRRVEDLLAQAAVARNDAATRHASEMSSAAARSSELEAALRVARTDLESKAADVDRLASRETDLSSRLAEVTTSRDDLERRLAATQAAFEDAGTRAAHERLAASKRADEREAELDGQIQQERAARGALEQAVAAADAALSDAQLRHDAALATAANERAERQAHFDRELSQTTADRDRVRQQLSEAEITLDTVRRDHASASADVERLTVRETDLSSRLAEVTASRGDLERRLAATE